MARSTGTGALILSGFSFLWLNWGASLLRFPQAGVWRLLFGGVCASLAVMAVVLLRKSPAMNAPREERGRIVRWFGLVNAVQWAAILGSVFLLNKLNRGEWFPWVASVIVALHFFALAPLQWRGHIWTGSAMLLLDGLALLLPEPQRYGVATLGSGVILLTVAMLGLLRMRTVLLQPRSA